MAHPPIPSLTRRAPTIDFIDQRLPKHHPAFGAPDVIYDPISMQFVPAAPTLVAQVPVPSNSSLATTLLSNSALVTSNLPQRPEWTDIKAMKFWNGIFPVAMAKFKRTKEPKGRTKSLYDIRDKTDWESVYNTLESARAKYQSRGGSVGWIRKVRRKAADNITPGAELAKIASKVAPQDQIATPVLGAIEVIFDAVKTAATVRNQVLAGFDGIVPIFSDVELFLSTFQGDGNIRFASIELTATTLEAVERAIGFFISNEFFRGGKALLSGEDYEKNLLESLEMIQSRATDLIQQGLKSHIFEFHMYSEETRKLHQQLVSRVDILVAGNNSIEQLLKDHLQQKDRELEAARLENINLRVELGILRSASPQQQNMWAPPSPRQVPALAWYITQDAVRNVIGIPDFDLQDVDFVLDRKEQLLPKDKAKAEQIIHTPLFRDWIVSASSAKLLVHWDFHRPRVVAEVSPLSVFCIMMAQSLQAKDRFIPALWFCGRHIDERESGGYVGGRVMLLSLIDQLLRQFQFDMKPLQNEVDLDDLQNGDMDVLVLLLNLLVRQLPPTITVFFLVDGVALFERAEFEAEALPAFLGLIHLVADVNIVATVKVLFTSTPGTDVVRGAFEQENLILNVDGLPQTAVASEERMLRELRDDLS